MLRLSFFKTHPHIELPRFATKGSACFDLSFQSAGKYTYKGYNSQNKEFSRNIHSGNQIYINPGDRILVPTGLILDIPEGYSVRVHARSGTALKKGLVLINAEGIIDSDYVDELFLLIHNASDNGHMLTSGDRIAQGEMIKNEEYALWETQTRPLIKSERIGGMGSTGVQLDVINYTSAPATPVIVTEEVKNEEQPVKRGRGRPRKVA